MNLKDVCRSEVAAVVAVMTFNFKSEVRAAPT
jgi:hypothetical protein